MNAEIERAEKEFKSASQALAAAVAKHFPVGTFVQVKWGRGYMASKVFATPNWWSYPGSVGVRSMTSGGMHWRDWHDLTEGQ